LRPSVVAAVPSGGVATPGVPSQLGSRPCERCRTTIDHPRPGQRFCSSGCRWEAWKARKDARAGTMRAVLEEALALTGAARLAIETALERAGLCP
jgi:predicted nucleic acid-binding Zn ribbon protein